MSLTDTESLQIREAIYVASLSASDSLKSALAQLNAMIIGGTYAEWANYQVIDEAIGRSPGYQAAWDALLRELKSAPPIGGPVTPEPTPPPSSYPTPPVSDLVSQLRALGIFCRGGKVGLGGEPVLDTDAALTIHGAQIIGVAEGNFQNPVRHENCLDICNSDGGMGFLQYGRWYQGKHIRNTTNRRQTNLKLDSMGDLCSSHMPVGATSDGGQSWYIRTDEQGIVEFCTYKVGKYIRILKSLFKYGDREGVQL